MIEKEPGAAKDGGLTIPPQLQKLGHEPTAMVAVELDGAGHRALVPIMERIILAQLPADPGSPATRHEP